MNIPRISPQRRVAHRKAEMFADNIICSHCGHPLGSTENCTYCGIERLNLRPHPEPEPVRPFEQGWRNW